MSTHRAIRVICPQCGRSFEAAVPESVNPGVNPEDWRRLLDGTLFEAQCACGARVAVDFPVLYHDPAKKLMVYYVKPEDVEQTGRMFEALQQDPAFAAAGYALRITTAPETLREKAMIFDAGMDDRVMEIIKLTYVLYMRRKYPKGHVVGALFVREGERLMLQAVAETPVESEITREFYEQLHAQYLPRLQTEHSTQVDFDWAVHFLGYDKQ